MYMVSTHLVGVLTAHFNGRKTFLHYLSLNSEDTRHKSQTQQDSASSSCHYSVTFHISHQGTDAKSWKRVRQTSY